jgi:hypothetical protein
MSFTIDAGRMTFDEVRDVAKELTNVVRRFGGSVGVGVGAPR